MLPKIYIVEDNPMVGMMMKQGLLEDDYDVKLFETGKAFMEAMTDFPDIAVLDYQLPDMSGLEILKTVRERFPKTLCIIYSGQEDVNVVVEAYNNGAKNYIVKNDNAIVELKNAIKNNLSSIQLQNEVELHREELEDRAKYHRIIGESSALYKVLKLIQRVEKTDTLAMITGESGTGKELIAEAIHYNSKRRKKPLVAVNLAAIPDHLVEDELFGHEKGAFTGASSRRKGRFEEANGGTIFLDEIGEIELSLQTKLLRVLQEKKISRLGSNKEMKLDLRVICATNKNLGQLVKEGKFREDLYYRIQGFLIHLPPLRERGNDSIVLAKHFVKHFADKHGFQIEGFTDDAIEALRKHPWTGNIRELIALVERSVLMSDGPQVTADNLIFSDAI